MDWTNGEVQERAESPSLDPNPASDAQINNNLPTASTSSSRIAPAPTLVPAIATNPLPQFDFSFTRSHPINRHNYRYTSCGPSPLPPDLPPFEPHPDSSLNPLTLYRTIPSIPEGVRFSWEDKSPFVSITEDARTITAEKGWRGARANVGLREGSWFWEVKVERGGGEGGRGWKDEQGESGEGEGSWVRVGVGRREGPINAPVGIDGHSYAFRDRSGDSVTLARPTPYGTPFRTSSTIGILLLLPPRPPVPTSKFLDPLDPSNIIRKRVPIRYKGALFYESLEYKPSREMSDLVDDPFSTKGKNEGTKEEEKKAAPGTKSNAKEIDTTPPPRPLPRLAGSKLIFFVDGVCQGIAFSDLFDFLPLRLDENDPKNRAVVKVQSADGRLNVLENFHDDGALGYYPMVSVFGGGVATLNPGPDFAFPPPTNLDEIIADSPHPQSMTATLSTPTALPTPSTLFTTPIRPLSERYTEFYSEQASLDSLDEAESIETYRSLLATEVHKLNSAPTGGKRSRIGSSTSKAESNSASMRGNGVVEGGMASMHGGGDLRNELLQLGNLGEISRRGSESGAATPEVSTPRPTNSGEELRFVQVEVRAGGDEPVGSDTISTDGLISGTRLEGEVDREGDVRME